MKTMTAWEESKFNFDEFVNTGDEIDQRMYDYFLGVVPPADMGNGYFLLGEPINTDNEGNLLYNKFSNEGGRFFYKGIVTRGY